MSILWRKLGLQRQNPGNWSPLNVEYDASRKSLLPSFFGPLSRQAEPSAIEPTGAGGRV